MIDLPREPRIDIRKGHSSREPFREIKRFFDSEIDPLFQLLVGDSVSSSFKYSLRKYLVIIIFAALDYLFRNAVRNLIDNNDMNVTSLFPPNSKKKLDKLIKESATTKGNIVASTYRFVDINDIDFVFSNLLKINSFLDYVIKLNDINQTRSVLDGHPIPIEYEKLTKAYKLRNDIAHEIKTVKVSKTLVIALWDNFMNIVDISQAILLSASDLELRYTLNSDYLKGRDRARRKAAYKFYSDKIMSILMKDDHKTTTYSRISMIEKNERSFNDKDIKDFIHWVILRMLKEELIVKNGELINLTLRGKNRFKRTTNIIRQKWRRELSTITCSWIATRNCYNLE